MKPINNAKLSDALILLEALLRQNNTEHIEPVVCGGSALIATGLIVRATKDLDIVALRQNGNLTDPSPLPIGFLEAARQVAHNLSLPEDWVNDGPADLFRMGLPPGFNERLISRVIGPALTVHFISRIDQIFFKLYASVDRGGYHIDDLLALGPASDELAAAGRWSCTHDVSDNFTTLLRDFLDKLGYGDAAKNI